MSGKEYANSRFVEPRSELGIDEVEPRSFPPRSQVRNPRPRAQATFRPPRVEGERWTGPPKPQNLLTTSTTSKNDPLFRESLLPGSEARPTQEVVVYPGFYSIDQIATEIHKSTSASARGFFRQVSQAAFHYYVAAISYARLLKVLHVPGRPLTRPEKSFMDMIYAGQYQIPALLGYYLDGLGKIKLNGHEVRVCAKTRDYIVSKTDDSTGWFGRVNHRTHMLYASYPCLAVYARRIQMDIVYTNVPDLEPKWNLPEDIKPEDNNAEFPTTNLLGYAPSIRLTHYQLQWLYECGYNKAGDCDSTHQTIPRLDGLLAGVQTALYGTKIKLVPMNTDNAGSLAQIVTTRVADEAVAAVEENNLDMIGTLGLYVNRAIVRAAESLRYLQKHHIDGEIQNWTIYKWNTFMNVPDNWRDSANLLYDSTSSIIKMQLFRTAPYSPVVEVRKLNDILNQHE